MVRGPRVSSSRPFFDFMGIGKGDRGRIGFSLYPGWSCVAGRKTKRALGNLFDSSVGFRIGIGL